MEIPKYILNGTTAGKWKAMKRRQMDQAIDALDAFMLGAAFTPCTGIIPLMHALKENREKLKEKNWI